MSLAEAEQLLDAINEKMPDRRAIIKQLAGNEHVIYFVADQKYIWNADDWSSTYLGIVQEKQTKVEAWTHYGGTS